MTLGQRRVHEMITSANFHGALMALIVVQIVLMGIETDAKGEGPWEEVVEWLQLFLSLVFMAELMLRTYVSASCRCARSKWGYVDALLVVVYFLSSIVDKMSVLVVAPRLPRYAMIVRGLLWAVPPRFRELLFAVLVLPVAHVTWAILCVELVHPIHAHAKEEGLDIPRDQFKTVPDAMKSLIVAWGDSLLLLPMHPWVGIIFAGYLFSYLYLICKGIYSACFVPTDSEEAKGLSQALWECETAV